MTESQKYWWQSAAPCVWPSHGANRPVLGAPSLVFSHSDIRPVCAECPISALGVAEVTRALLVWSSSAEDRCTQGCTHGLLKGWSGCSGSGERLVWAESLLEHLRRVSNGAGTINREGRGMWRVFDIQNERSAGTKGIRWEKAGSVSGCRLSGYG